MHKLIITHANYITPENIVEMSELNFFFLCMDKCEIKKVIIDYLVANNVSFIDVGMGVHVIEDKLFGILRTTSSTINKRDHIEKRINFSEEIDDDYTTNIQIADLNSLNAAFAVIKWKKISNYYQDFEKEFNSTYTINTGQLINEDYEV
jgi:hypothetical protein